jgi:hypothetical protein
MTQVRCVSNALIVETGRSGELFATRWVPLTIGETYPQVPGPQKPHHHFILDDEQEVRSYPDYLFEDVA